MIKIKNMADKAEIFLYGIIVDDTDANWLVQNEDGSIGYQYPAEIKAQLDALKGIPITVHVASDGGNIAAGIAIFNMLKNHDAPVDIYVDSWAASIASFICFAGRKVYMPENTFMMIHNPAGGGFGEAEYLRSIADWLDKLKNMIADTYASHSEKSIDEIKALMDKETWLSAKEASELFDIVELTASNEIQAVAEYKSSFKNAPKNLLPKSEEEIEAENKAKAEAESKAKAEAEAKAKEEAEAKEKAVNEIKNKISLVLMEAYKYEKEG